MKKKKKDLKVFSGHRPRFVRFRFHPSGFRLYAVPSSSEVRISFMLISAIDIQPLVCHSSPYPTPPHSHALARSGAIHFFVYVV